MTREQGRQLGYLLDGSVAALTDPCTGMQYLIIVAGQESLADWMEGEGFPADDLREVEHWGGCAWEPNELPGLDKIVIWVSTDETTDAARFAGILAHEALHAAVITMKCHGNRMPKGGIAQEEALAYLTGWLVGRMTKLHATGDAGDADYLGFWRKSEKWDEEQDRGQAACRV